MTNNQPTLPTPTEARALLRAERTRLTRRCVELKQVMRQAVSELDRLERRLGEVEEGERQLPGGRMTTTDDTRIKALILYPESTTRPHAQRIEPSLTLYQQIVGGLITAVDGHTESGARVILYSHDEAITEGLPVNPVATLLWRALNPDAAQEFLLGPVIVTGARGADDADVPDEVVTLARQVAKQVEIEGYSAQLQAQQARAAWYQDMADDYEQNPITAEGLKPQPFDRE